MASSPDGKRLASASDDQTLPLWDVDSRQPLGQPLAGQTNSVVFSPDGKLLASVGYHELVRLWDVTTRQPLTGHTDSEQAIGVDPYAEELYRRAIVLLSGLDRVDVARQLFRQLGRALPTSTPIPRGGDRAAARRAVSQRHGPAESEGRPSTTSA